MDQNSRHISSKRDSSTRCLGTQKKIWGERYTLGNLLACRLRWSPKVSYNPMFSGWKLPVINRLSKQRKYEKQFENIWKFWKGVIKDHWKQKRLYTCKYSWPLCIWVHEIYIFHLSIFINSSQYPKNCK